jgi:hypothetical protein
MLLGTGHSETVDPVGASNCVIFLPDTTKRLSLNQRRPVLNHGVTVTLMSINERPSLLSQTRTEFSVAVVIRSPCYGKHDRHAHFCGPECFFCGRFFLVWSYGFGGHGTPLRRIVCSLL